MVTLMRNHFRICPPSKVTVGRTAHKWKLGFQQRILMAQQMFLECLLVIGHEVATRMLTLESFFFRMLRPHVYIQVKLLKGSIIAVFAFEPLLYPWCFSMHPSPVILKAVLATSCILTLFTTILCLYYVHIVNVVLEIALVAEFLWAQSAGKVFLSIRIVSGPHMGF